MQACNPMERARICNIRMQKVHANSASPPLRFLLSFSVSNFTSKHTAHGLAIYGFGISERIRSLARCVLRYFFFIDWDIWNLHSHTHILICDRAHFHPQDQSRAAMSKTSEDSRKFHFSTTRFFCDFPQKFANSHPLP